MARSFTFGILSNAQNAQNAPIARKALGLGGPLPTRPLFIGHQGITGHTGHTGQTGQTGKSVTKGNVLCP